MIIHILATVLLGPILFVQGQFVRWRIEKLPEPPGARRGSVGKGKEIKLLIVGDSAGAGVGAQHQNEALLGQTLWELTPHYNVHYELLANTGDTSADCISRIEDLPKQDFDVIVTSVGANDVTSLSTEREFERRINRLVGALKKRFSPKIVILSGLPPMGEFPALPHPLRWYIGRQAQRFDAVVERVSLQQNTDYIKFDFGSDPGLAASDGFHPGPKVYTIWGRVVASIVAKRLPPD